MEDPIITAVIIDDHQVVLDGVRSWCRQADPPIDLIDADARINGAWTGPGATADVVILDLHLETDRPPLDNLKRLVQSRRKVVIFTGDTTNAIRCMDQGALAYVTKNEGEEHLVKAIRAAALGRSYTPPALSGAIAADKRPEIPDLTDQQLRALIAWCGSANKKLAAQSMNIAESTLNTYIKRARDRYKQAGRPAPTKSQIEHRLLEDGRIDYDDLV